MGTMKSCRFLAPLVLGAAVLLLARCGLEQAEAPSGTFRSVFQAFQSNNCTECHTPTGAAWQSDGVQLDFSDASAAYTGLTTQNVMGASSVGNCPGVKLVVPGDLNKSYFAAVLFDDIPQDDFAGVTGCTVYPTHHADVNLSASQQTSIRAWIQNGANND